MLGFVCIAVGHYVSRGSEYYAVEGVILVYVLQHSALPSVGELYSRGSVDIEK